MRPPCIGNPNYSSRTATMLPVERAWLYRPEAEWTYSHHPHLYWYAGRYYAIWSNGRRDEDAPGQRVLISSSGDFHTWTAPAPLFDTRQVAYGEAVLTAAGFHQHDNRLVAYAGSYEYRPECLDEHGQRRSGDKGHVQTTLLAMSTTDGTHWEGPRDLRLPIVPNHGPQRTATGRLIISGNISFPYTDDPTGLAGWRMTGIYPSEMADMIVDDSESFWQVQQAAGWPVPQCEGSFFQTDDGVLHMLLRTNTERLWQSTSRDDGATWSPPRPTEFSDNATKFHFGHLPDGRFYYIGCPDPEPRWTRSPLVLSLSGDGVRFDRHFILADARTPYERRADGLHKGGDYGYPHTLVHTGALHVIVSRRKEAVEVLRVPLANMQ
ncbi:MAG: exo-alpha-sialidase [Armatimonadota bacterium]